MLETRIGLRRIVIVRIFLIACLAAIAIAGGAAYVLNSGYVPNASSTVFSTSGVRI
jgi:hypothetical protein